MIFFRVRVLFGSKRLYYNEQKLKRLEDEIRGQEEKLLLKREKNVKLKIDIENAKTQTQSLEEQQDEKYQVKITKRDVKRRLSNPTSHQLNKKAKSVRRNETYHSCQAIHGGTDADTNPTLIGMVDTITCKFKSEEASKVILCSKRSLQRSLQKDLVKNWTRSYKISKQNKLRSLNVY